MSNAVVKPGQTLEDIAVQWCGSEEAVWELARLNGLGLTDDIAPGAVLSLPAVIDSLAVRSFVEGVWAPAGALDGGAVVSLPQLAALQIEVQVSGFAVVQPGQTLEDIAVQWCGGEEAVWELARLNGLGLTADIIPGALLRLPTVVDKRVRRVYVERGWAPAAGGVEEVQEGIDYMAISVDFIVT